MSQYPWLLLAVYVVTVGVVQLLALWAAASRLPWLLRALVVWAPIALLLPIRAYEPALLLTMSATLTIILELCVQHIARRRAGTAPLSLQWRFRLADLLVAILLIATLVGIGKQVVDRPKHVYFALQILALLSLPIGLITLLAYRSIIGPGRGIKLFFLLGIIWVCALVLRATNAPLYLGEGYPSLGAHSPTDTANHIGTLGVMATGAVLCPVFPIAAWAITRNRQADFRRRAMLLATAVATACVVPLGCLMWESLRSEAWNTIWQWCLEIVIHSVAFVALAVLIALGTWLAKSSQGDAGWKRWLARGTAIGLVLIACWPAAWIYWQMLRTPAFPSADYGRANNYYRIMEIGDRTKGYMNSTAVLPQNLQSEVDEAAVLLRGSNYVPVEELEAESRKTNQKAGLSAHEWLSLQQRLSDAAVEADNNGQPDRVADYSIAVIRYGTMFERGGHAGYAWVAGSFQEFGYQRLAIHRADFSETTCRELIHLLQQSLRERDDIDLLLLRAEISVERTGHWYAKLTSILRRLSSDDAVRAKAAVALQESRSRLEATNRLLQTDLAIRLFQSDHGRLPQSLAELAPEYLEELPLDPYSGQSLIYRPSEEGGELYSVGPDGNDDGGIFLYRPPRDGKYPYDVRLLQVPLK